MRILTIVASLFVFATFMSSCATNVAAKYEIFTDAVQAGDAVTALSYAPDEKDDALRVKATGTQEIFFDCTVQKTTALVAPTPKSDNLRKVDRWEMTCTDSKIMFTFPVYILEADQSVLVLSEHQEITLPPQSLIQQGEETGVYLPAEIKYIQLNQSATASQPFTPKDHATKVAEVTVEKIE